MSRLATAEQMTQYDIVPPENFMRGQLDRSIASVNSYFARAFGLDRAPLQASVDRLRAVGSVALFDVGCGTGNSLRTWAEAVRRHAASPEQVSAIGLNLHDYSNQSRFAQTRQAIQEERISYIVGDAEKMADAPDGSADVVIACMSVLHMTHPALALQEMERIAGPGGIMYLNVKGSQYVSNSPVMETLFEWEDADYKVETQLANVSDLGGTGRPWTTSFIRVEKP
ncbi:MAG: class I SAM-dependent methyltransferase [Patescibacteria group bacterium]